MQFCISTTIFTMILKFCQIEVLGGTRSTNEKKIGNFFSQKFFIQIFKDRFLYNYLSDWCKILTKYSLRRGEPNSVKKLFGKKMYFLIVLFKICTIFFYKFLFRWLLLILQYCLDLDLGEIRGQICCK